MYACTVHEPPNPPRSRVLRAERLEFVREGFSWVAALLAPIWMLAHRMWLALVAYILVVAAINVALPAAGVTSQWAGLATAALHLVIGFESAVLRRWTLERQRWSMLGAVVGRSRLECERRFFDGWLAETREADEPSADPARLPPPDPAAPPDSGRDATPDSPGPRAQGG